MRTLKLLVKGIVQRVGYRAFVERVARQLKIKGTVKNLADADESVEIIIQHKDRLVTEEFLKKINIRTELVNVEQITKQEVEQPEFVKFEVLRGSYEEENAERLDVAAAHLDNLTREMREARTENKEGFSDVNNKLDKTNEKLESIDEKLEHGFAGNHKRLEKIDQTMSEQMLELRQRVSKIEQVLHIKS
ncbi:MAG: acylphosphatase [Candidatus Micrarchaeota archaeon]